MELRYVREFISLAQTRSFLETSLQLYISTSALSRHIQALEKDLGVPLFQRTTRKVILTEQGRLFLTYANRLVNTEDEWKKALYETGIIKRSVLTIGSIPTWMSYNIANLVAEFNRINSGITLEIKEADSFELLPLLQSGACDFAFIRDMDAGETEFQRLPFVSDKLCIAVPDSHPFAVREFVAIEDLKDEALLFISKNSFMHKLCTDLCIRGGFQPNVVFMSKRGSNLLEFVARGMGIAMLMKKAAESLKRPDNICFIEIRPIVSSSICLFYKEKILSDPVSASFFSLAQKMSETKQE